MINLLSPNDKSQLRAARRNVLLLRYNLLIATTLIVVGGIFGGGIFIGQREQAQAQLDLDIDHQQSARYQAVRQEAESFENNLNIANRILADEITYSTVITDIAQVLPANVVLTSLTLNPEIFNTPTTLEARTVNYEAGLALQARLEESDIFSEVSIQNITSNETDPEAQGGASYPISVTLNVVLAHPNTTASTQPETSQ